jgi:cytochrome c-type biogenesis protein CcmH/NrfF
MRRLLVLAALLLALLAPAVAGAATPRTSLPDIEDQVMCLECGTALNVSTSAVADEERAFIRQLIARGMTKQQVLDEMVAEYGPKVLAQPQGRGFQLTGWLIPIVAALLAFGGVVILARSWRQRRSPEEEAGGGPGLADADARRLDDELAAFDR